MIKQRSHTKFLLIIFALLSLSACSMNEMMVKASLPMIKGGMDAMNKEADLKLAEDSLPANIGMLNGMIQMAPKNAQLRVYAAQAYYGISYGFNEDKNFRRAKAFYARGLKHGLLAFKLNGAKDFNKISNNELEQELQKLGKDDLPALFWTASNWAKLIFLNRDKPSSLIQLPKPTAMMQRVLELDDTFYHGGAHMYFGVYYGARPPTFGGDFKKSKFHFDRAREINNDKLLIVDLLQAQFLSRQMFDQKDFHNRLTKIINAPVNLYPKLTLLNQIAKRKAKLYLRQEAKWF